MNICTQSKGVGMKYSELSKRQAAYVDAILEHAPDLGIKTDKTDFSRAELRQVSMNLKGKVWIPNWITHDQSRRVSRAVFSIPEVSDAVAEAVAASVLAVPAIEASDEMVVEASDEMVEIVMS